MSLQLRVEWRGTRFPPGAFPFTDPKTGYKFDANAGNLDFRIKDVRKHRLANPNVYSDKKYLDEDFIRQEIIEFMCHKTPEICQEGDVDVSTIKVSDPSKVVQTQTCTNCGSSTNAHPVFCASCGSGDRVKYWLCSCGMKI